MIFVLSLLTRQTSEPGWIDERASERDEGRAQQRRMNSEKIGIRVKVGSHDDDEAANGASTGMNKFLEGNQ